MTPEHVSEDNADEREVDRDALVAAFDREDPRLEPLEKETTFRFARDESVVTFFTAESGVGRRLIAHPEVVLDAVVLMDEDRRPSVDPAEVTADEDIVGVRGTLPVGALSIKASARKSDQHAQIVSNRVFADGGDE